MMTESRICPVCENDLPEDAKFFCPQCISEMNWLDDVKDLPEEKYSFDRLEDDKYIAMRKKVSDRMILDTLTSTVRKPISCLSIITGLIIIIWWATSWFFMDSMSELMCFVIFLPGVVGLLLLVVGLALWKG